jgi:hypothetical protein
MGRVIFTNDEVAVLSRFGGQLQDWVDDEIVEQWLSDAGSSLDKRRAWFHKWVADGGYCSERLLTTLFIKRCVFMQQEGVHVEEELERFKVEVTGVVVPLFK